MASKDDLGRWGEQMAADHLERQGLVVLARNWRCSEGEIDIVATDGVACIVICEVKTRSGVGYGLPAEAVTLGKRRKLRRLAQVYMATEFQHWLKIRFDVIAVLAGSGSTPELTHYESAF